MITNNDEVRVVELVACLWRAEGGEGERGGGGDSPARRRINRLFLFWVNVISEQFLHSMKKFKKLLLKQ